MGALLGCAVLALGCGAKTGVIDPEYDGGPPPEDAGPECHEDVDCDDRTFCNGEERCIGGHCIDGVRERCTDGDLCTVDRCDVDADACVVESLRYDRDGDSHYPIPCGDDCDDEDAQIYPGALERCNGKDDDCDLLVDEELLFLPTRVEARVTDNDVPDFSQGLAWVEDHWAASHYDQADPSVYLSLLEESGAPMDAAIDLSVHPGDAYGAGLAWSGRTIGTIWEDRRDGDFEIYFQRLNAQGQKLMADLRITFALEFSINSSIIWTEEEFAIIWQDSRYWTVEPDNDEVFFQRVSEDGEPLGLEVQVTDSADPSTDPSVAWSGEEYGVAWVEIVGGDRHSIFFRRLSAEGESVSDPMQVASGAGESTDPALVWADGEWGMVFEESLGDCAGASTGIPGSCFMRLSEAGEVVSEQRVDDGSSYARFPSLRWTGSDYILLWSDWRNGQFELYYAMVDPDGETLIADTRITEASGDSIGGSMSAGPGDYGILFTDTRDGNYEVYFTALSCNAEPTVD